jgi:hypothetical protein
MATEDIGTLLVKIDASTKGLEQGVTKAGSLFGNLAKGIAGIGAVVATGAFLKSAIDEAAEAQDGLKQLNTVIASTGGKAGVTAEQVTSMAAALQQSTKFSDDAVIAGDNLLLTFTNIGKDVFPAATETMLNMSQALGQDVKGSAIQLGKALNDPIQGVTALRRVGVSFTESQLEQIKAMQESGNLMGAQKLILKELETEFGGAARAAGETFSGKLERLKNQFGEVKETIGGALLPVLSTLAEWLIGKLPGALNKLADIFNEIGDAYQFLADGFKGDGDPEALLGSWEYWIYQVGAAVATLSNGISTLTDFIVKNQDIILAVAAGIGGAVLAFGAYTLALNAMTIATGIWTTVTGIATGVATAFAAVLAFITSPIGIVVLAIGALVAAGILLYKNWDTISTFFSTIWTTMTTTVVNAINAIGAFITTSWNSIKDFATQVWNGIKNAVVGAFEWMYNHNYYFKALVDFISKTWDSLKKVTQEVWDAIIWALKVVWDAIVAAATWHWNAISTITTSTWNAIKGFLSGLWASIRDVASTAWASIYSVISGIWDKLRAGFSDLVKSAADWGKNLIANFINGITGMMGNLWDMLKKVGEMVAGFLGFHSPTKLGPGREADEWAPNFVNMFTKGIEANLPGLRKSLADMALTLQPSLVGGSNTTTNTFQIHIQGNNASSQADALIRELHRRGVKF